MAAKLETVSPLLPESTRLELEKILGCRAFAASEQLRGFLRFTVELTLRVGTTRTPQAIGLRHN